MPSAADSTQLSMMCRRSRYALPCRPPRASNGVRHVLAMTTDSCAVLSVHCRKPCTTCPFEVSPAHKQPPRQNRRIKRTCRWRTPKWTAHPIRPPTNLKNKRIFFVAKPGNAAAQVYESRGESSSRRRVHAAETTKTKPRANPVQPEARNGRSH
jgi:hypothetical protein